MSESVIKTNKGFHVNEDFYEALINGLQCERDKEKRDKNDNGGKILSSKQQRFLKRVTAPIILDQMSRGGLLGDYMSLRYNSHKTKKILEYQRKAYAFLKFYQDQDEVLVEIEDEAESEDKRLSFMQMYKMYRTLRRLWGLYDLYKTITDKTSKVEKREFNFGEYDLRNPADYAKFQGDFNEYINGSQSYIVNIMEIVLREITIALFRSVDRAFERINLAIYRKIFLMAAQAAAEQVAWHFVGGILEATGIGFVMHAAGAVRAARWARKIGNYIGGIKNVAKTVQKLNKHKDVLRVANALQTINNSFIARTATKMTINVSRAGIEMYNIVTISNQELVEMERLITNQVQRRTGVAETQLKGRVEALRNVNIDLTDNFEAISLDLQGRIDTINLGKIDYSFISQRYKRDITIKGIDDSPITKTLGDLGNFFQTFWRKVDLNDFEMNLNESFKKVNMTDKGFSGKTAKDSKQYFFEVFFSKSFDNEGEKPVWWNTNKHHWMHKFMQVKVNSQDFDAYYLGLSQGFSAYFMKDGKLVSGIAGKHKTVDYTKNRFVFRSGNRGAFERIYTDGIESGYKIRLYKSIFKEGRGVEYEPYNLKEIDENSDIKYTFATPPDGVKVSYTEDGRLLINMDDLTVKKQGDILRGINSLLTEKEKELIAEKRFQDQLKELAKIIEEKLTHKDEEQTSLREDATRLIREYNSLQGRESICTPGISPGSMVVSYRTVKVTNYNQQKWDNIVNKMSSTQLRALIERINAIQGDTNTKIKEMIKLNQAMYASH